jgi:pyruvate kinase
MKIIAKIESSEGRENIREIAALADGVMVARGDLGVQLPIEQIPLAQKHIISVCRKIGKPVITETQMLESMIVNPRPTRAELTDVANAIFDGTDAVMLSGETAAGAYPVEAVKTMDKIALTVEHSPEFLSRMKKLRGECLSWDHTPGDNLGIIMSRSGVEIASEVNVKAIVAPTLTGNTARILSVFRPDEPILALTPDKHAERVMQLYWGVRVYYAPRVDKSESLIQKVIKAALDTGTAGISDKIILVAGLPLESPNMVNTVRVLILGTVLARSGAGGYARTGLTRRHGRVVHAESAEEARKKITPPGASGGEHSPFHGSAEYTGGDILVCKTLTEDYLPFIPLVNGVICKGVSEISEQKLREANPDLVWLTHAKKGIEKIESGITVTLDAEQLLVYEGTI